MGRCILAPTAEHLRAALVLFLLSLAAPTLQAQVCEDVRLQTQAAVDAFNCAEVTGYLIIDSYPLPTTDIQNLDGLSELTSVEGLLRVFAHDFLQNIDGLANLTAVGGELHIGGNDALQNLDGLAALDSVGGDLNISYNHALQDIDGLAGLTSVGEGVYIANNPVLQNIDGLLGLTSAGRFLTITENQALSNVDGLANIAVADDWRIADNYSLRDVDGLAGLTHVVTELRIESNGSLQNIDGLVGLTVVEGNLFIISNSALQNFDGLANLTTVGGDLLLMNSNATNVDGLGRLTSIGGDLRIQSNSALLNVDGLSNLSTIGSGALRVLSNARLSECTTGLSPIVSGGGLSWIELRGNAPGCNSVCEVMGSCTDAESEPDAPRPGLAPPHPNPVRTATTLAYALAEPGAATLAVYDARGRLLQTLADGEHAAGAYAVSWSGTGLPAGVYLVQLVAGEASWTQRVTLIE